MRTKIAVSLAVLTAYGLGWYSSRQTGARGRIDAMAPVVRLADVQRTDAGGNVYDGFVSSVQVGDDVRKYDVPDDARTATPVRLQGTVNERPFLAFVHFRAGKRYGE